MDKLSGSEYSSKDYWFYLRESNFFFRLARVFGVYWNWLIQNSKLPRRDHIKWICVDVLKRVATLVLSSLNSSTISIKFRLFPMKMLNSVELMKWILIPRNLVPLNQNKLLLLFSSTKGGNVCIALCFIWFAGVYIFSACAHCTIAINYVYCVRMNSSFIRIEQFFRWMLQWLCDKIFYVGYLFVVIFHLW